MKSKESDDIEGALRPELDEALLALEEFALENPEEALVMFDSLPEPVQALADFQLTLARAHQAAGQLDAARDIVAGVLARDARDANAHHLLGDLLDDLGREDQANEHFVQVLKLDRQAYESLSTAERIGEEELESHLHRICDPLIERQGVSLEIRAFPSEQEVLAGLDPRALLFVSSQESVVVFLANVQEEFGDLRDTSDFETELASALSRELSDAFGLSADDRVALGLPSLEIDGASDGVGDQRG